MCVCGENSWLDKSMLYLVRFFPAMHKGCDKGCVRPQFVVFWLYLVEGEGGIARARG